MRLGEAQIVAREPFSVCASGVDSSPFTVGRERLTPNCQLLTPDA